MTQSINPTKLKSAAEHLEWVLKEYPDNDDVQILLSALRPLIDDAKNGRILEPTEKIPCEFKIADGIYTSFTQPDVEGSYYEFAAELRGGRNEFEKRGIEWLAHVMKDRNK